MGKTDAPKREPKSPKELAQAMFNAAKRKAGKPTPPSVKLSD